MWIALRLKSNKLIPAPGKWAIEKNMQTETEKRLTWQQLKEFCNKIPEQFLTNEVSVIGEERGFDIEIAETLEEDYYQDDYAFQPVSVFDDTDGEVFEDMGYDITPKGSPFLYIDL